jgi:glutamine synthetase
MGTDTGANLLEPGDTPHENISFLFFCAAVIAAVNRHQALLRASVANVGQDHRLGANEAPPAIISIFLGKELADVYEAIEQGVAGEAKPGGILGLGTPVLPPLPMHGGDRNRTSPFAFTGNKFEFRAVGSTQTVAFPNTILNTIVAEAIDDLAGQLQDAMNGGASLEDALRPVLQKSWAAHKRIVFDGDGYSEAWHKEAEEQRGLLNLRTTPDALPYFVRPETIAVFERYEVLNERELEARYEVFTEQYAVKLNIEAETAASIARTLLLPAALRHLALLKEAGVGELVAETEALVGEFVTAIRALETVNAAENQEDEPPAAWAVFMRDKVIPAMESVRDVADRLEKIVADDLWPLPKYSEVLFIK